MLINIRNVAFDLTTLERCIDGYEYTNMYGIHNYFVQLKLKDKTTFKIDTRSLKYSKKLIRLLYYLKVLEKNMMKKLIK